MASSVPANITTALVQTFTSDADALARILYFLAKSLSEGPGVADPFINSLQNVVAIPVVFKKVAERMAEDTKTAAEDPRYRQFMQDIWSNFLKDNLSEFQSGGQGWALTVQGNSVNASAQYSFMRAVAQLPEESFVALQEVVQVIGGASAIAVYTNRALSAARLAQPLVRVALVTVFLAWDILVNIRRWWNGEITGVRCVKNIIDNGVSVAAGLAGGVGGEMVGVTIGGIVGGPLGAGMGAVAGALFGAVGASMAASAICDKLTQWVFGLPKSEALEVAYTFLGVSLTSSNSDINHRYRQLALQYHPDKGGDPDLWTRLQYSMAVIRQARGEY